MLKKLLKTIKPGVPLRNLLFIAALVWTFAGGMLMLRGISISLKMNTFPWTADFISLLGGILFYILLFSKISRKHTNRIVHLTNDFPCMFSFFSVKSYLVMACMITAGILVRKSGLLPPIYLAVLYITMGIPLFISSFRFYYYGIFYNKIKIDNI